MPSRRDYRRQGVVYGPPRGRQPAGEAGTVIGRFMGLGILLLSFVALAAGALAFIGNERAGIAAASRSPGPTRTARPSILVPRGTPAALPTIAPTPTFDAVPSISATAAASFETPLVQIGPGFVTFGTQTDAEFRVVDPKASFGPGERISWSAYLTEPADAVQLHVQIVKLDPSAAGGEVIISDAPVTDVIRDAQIYQRRRIRPEVALAGPGIYTVLYLKGEEVLSVGSFELTP